VVRAVLRVVCTDVRVPAISINTRDRLAFWALAGVSLLAAHDAIYLAQIGPGQALAAALRTAGHGYWGWASLGLTIVAVVVAISIWLRIRHLRHRASVLGATGGAAGPFARRFAITWLRLAAVVTVGFVIQENVEHLIVHAHAPGAAAIIGPEHPLAVPVIGLISGISAVLAAAIGGAQEALVVAIEAALRRAIRPLRVVRRPASRLVVAIGPVMSRRGAGRAPPTLVVSAI
jgi:hypothetical protein